MPERVVVTLHGIRTRGVWQKDLVPLLARVGFVPYVFDYGDFSALSLMRAVRRDEKVRWFVDLYGRIRAETGVDRPSIIAHSFGTRIVADAIEHNPEIKFDKVIFCGSIVRDDFDWPSHIARRQVNFVRNDYGRLDIWPRMAKTFIAGSGSSGTGGFASADLMLSQHPFPKYRHSDYFNRTHFERYWIRTLVLDVRRLRSLLAVSARLAAHDLGIDPATVRTYVFVPEPERQFLRIPMELNYNLPENEASRTIPIDLRHVVTPGIGEAFESGAANFVQVRADFRWEMLPTTSAIRPAPDLSWVLSIPMFEETGNRVVGIFCADGIAPAGDDKLAILLDSMVPLAQQMAKEIAAVERWL